MQLAFGTTQAGSLYKGGTAMVYLVISTTILIACIFISVEVLSFVRAERLSQRTRIPVDRGMRGAPPLLSGAPKASTKAASFLSRKHDTPFARKLRAGGITVNPTLLLGLGIGVAMLFAFFAATISANPLFGVAGALLAFVAMNLLVKRRIRKRVELFDVQLAQALPRIAASVRGALTLERALRVAVIHMEDPLREEFKQVLSDTSYGMPLSGALLAMADRTQNDDVRTLANATKVRQGSGGSISAVLSMVSNRLDARLKAAGELKIEIAGTRMAKWFVAAAMPLLFFVMYFTNASFARFYLEEPLGWLVLSIAATMEVAGLLASHGITSVGRP